MSTLLQTIRFFHSLLTKKPKNTLKSTIPLLINSTTTLATDVYQPVGGDHGSIIFFHGMNKHGKDDERLQLFCRCLATAGYRVIVPAYSQITQHIFSVGTIDDFADTLQTITQDRTLCPAGKVSVFTASFSGTLALRACLHPETQPHINAFLTIGSAFYVRDVFRSGFENPESDKYMQLICAKNVLMSDPSIDTEVIAALDVAINDVFLPEEPARLPTVLPNLQPKNRELTERIAQTQNNGFLYQRYYEYLAGIEEAIFTSGDDRLLTFPLIFMHSVTDKVFSPEETLKISSYLERKNVKHSVFVTSLLEHVNYGFPVKKLPETIKMIWLFYRYFKATNNKA